jgi:hypothetical protein
VRGVLADAAEDPRRHGGAARASRRRGLGGHRSDARAARLVAKGGAEGLFCVSDGTDAWTLKVEDGATRALLPPSVSCSASMRSARSRCATAAGKSSGSIA